MRTEDNLDRFVGTKELAELMGCSVAQAREMMKREGFPVIKIGRKLKVQLRQLAQWASVRRD